MGATKIILEESSDGHVYKVLLDRGDGEEIEIPHVLEVAHVQSNERRDKVRLELRASVERRRP